MAIIYLINSKIINNEHTLYFDNLNDQIEYFQSAAFKVLTEYNYQRKDNVIRVNEYIDNVIKCNYVMYQNTDLSSKWYFAFVKEVKYHNTDYTDLVIETDSIQTWLFDYKVGECFVEREHVNNDTIGLHTIPENLETGEYISTNIQPLETFKYDYDNCVGVVALSELIGDLKDIATTINYEIPGGLYYIGCTTHKGMKELIELYDKNGKADAVQYVFVAPKEFFGDFMVLSYEDKVLKAHIWLIDNWSPAITGTKMDGEFAVRVSFELNKGVSIARLNYLGKNYVPRNNKLLTAPYNFLQVSNNAGNVSTYFWEEFNRLEDDSNDGNIKFKLIGTISPGCSFKCYPINYKNMLNNYDESISIGKLPIGAWNSDVYTNWLTQNAVNIGVNVATSVLTIVGGVAMASTGAGALMGAGAITSGFLNIAGTLGQVYERKVVPDQARGNTNNGDVNYQFGLTSLHFKNITIKNEYASMIDTYFDMYGYKVATCKVPNKNHRKNYWFTKTINANISGNVPQSDLNKIIDAYDKGITFWKTPANFRKYSSTNTII